MTRKTELLIEKFPQGVTVRTNDASTKKEVVKAIAVEGEEALCVGDSLWDCVADALGQSENGKVEVLIEVRSI